MNPEPRESKNPPEVPIKTYNKGSASGKIVGGNLSLLADTMGTLMR